MFDVQNLSLAFGGRPILHRASFKVEDGERAAIIGANGTGKSTLLRLIAGIITPDEGTVSVPKNTEVGYLPQEITLESDHSVIGECRQVYADLLEHEEEMRRLEEQMSHVDHDSPKFQSIAERYEYLLHETQRRDLYSMDATIKKVLGGLGFQTKDYERPCNEFSGGWQMRIALAKILLQNPDVILLDEPTNHLDIESIEWLAQWIQGHNGSVLMVSHERSFMDALAKKVVEIDRGEVVVYRGNFSQAVEKRAERRDIQQRTYENQQQQIAHIQKFVDRFRYQASKAALVQSRVKQLEKIEQVQAPTPDQGTIKFQFPSAPRSAKEVITAEGVSKAYGSLTVLDRVDFTLYRGEKVALVGVNGAGKTTLMRILAGRDGDYRGKCEYGSNVDASYFAQYDKEDLHPDNTVLGEFHATVPLSVSDKARHILGAFLFSGDDVQKKIHMLSGGERTRLRLAKMLCGKANLLLLDEPTNHLDIGSRLTLEEALRQYDGAVVLVSHDRYFLDNVVTRIVEVSDGGLKNYPGNYSDYLSLKELHENGGGGNGAAQPAVSKKVDSKRLAEQIAATPKKESSSERRDRQQRERHAKNRLRKIEREVEEHEDMIYQLEEAIRQIENEMAQPEASTNPQRLQELSAKLEKVQSKKEEVEGNWLSLQEEAEELESLLE